MRLFLGGRKDVTTSAGRVEQVLKDLSPPDSSNPETIAEPEVDFASPNTHPGLGRPQTGFDGLFGSCGALLGFGVNVRFPFGDERPELAYQIAVLLSDVVPFTGYAAPVRGLVPFGPMLPT